MYVYSLIGSDYQNLAASATQNGFEGSHLADVVAAEGVDFGLEFWGANHVQHGGEQVAFVEFDGDYEVVLFLEQWYEVESHGAGGGQDAESDVGASALDGGGYGEMGVFFAVVAGYGFGRYA